MSPASPLPSPIFLAGPTAAGKSAIAVELASMVGGEIISVDSMQVYQGLDVGTAKPNAVDLQRVRHHLISILPLTESFDAAKFVTRARTAAAEIQSRGNHPIFCGGTGFYISAYLEGLGDAPASLPALRAEIECLPPEALVEEIERRDPALAAVIDRGNRRRLVRAVEVMRLTGRPFSEQRARWAPPDSRHPGLEHHFVLTRSPETLRRRIESRVDSMIQAGWVDETEALLDKGLLQNRTAMQAIGYRQIVEYLRHERSFEDTKAIIKLRTKQFAKRQLTWLRGKFPAQWLLLAEDTAAEATARELAAAVRRG